MDRFKRFFLLASVSVMFSSGGLSAPGWAQTVKEQFEKADLVGRYAQDCAKPTTDQNLFINHVAVEPDRIRHDRYNSATNRQLSLAVDRVTPPKGNEFAFSGLAGTKRNDIALRLDGKRFRLMESAEEGGTVLISGGRYTKGNAETPWFNKCLGPENTLSTGVYSPDRIHDDIEEAARKRQQANSAPLARGTFWHLIYPRNASEMAALARYSVFFLAAISQKPEELPLKRVFHRAGGQDRPILKVSSWRSDLPAASLGHKMYGAYREDGFYLVPTMIVLKDGQILIDFGANSLNYAVWKLPAVGAQEALKSYSNLDPGNAKPSLAALQTLVKQKFTGFPVPTSVP
jgi:hypothetical protein